MRLLGETIYRRMLVLEGTVDQPPTRFEPQEGVEFGPLQPDEIEQYLRHRPDQPRSEIETRLAAGQVCFAARDMGGLVQTCWFAPDAWIEYLDWELPLAPEEAYVYDFYAVPSARGGNIFRTQISEMYAFFSDHEERRRWFPHHDLDGRFVTAFHLENRIWSLVVRAGLRPREIVGYIGVGRLRWHFRRPAPGEQKLRRAARRNALRQRRHRRARSAAADSGASAAPGTEMPSRP
jgi:hypothetical protein